MPLAVARAGFVGQRPSPFTQEYLAEMLGVRRTSVTEVAHTLAGSGSDQICAGQDLRSWMRRHCVKAPETLLARFGPGLHQKLRLELLQNSLPPSLRSPSRDAGGRAGDADDRSRHVGPRVIANQRVGALPVRGRVVFR